MSAAQQSVLSNVQGYIQRILLNYSISGQFPEGWSIADHDAFLRDNHLAVCLAVSCFDGGPLDHSLRQAMEQELLERFDVCSKAYQHHIVCLALLPLDTLDAVAQAAHQHLLSVFSSRGLHVSNYASALNPGVGALPETYRNLHAQAASVPMDSQARYSMLIHLYSLEDELNERIFDVDANEIRCILDEITQIIVTANADNRINALGYFCFLWRDVERAIFRRVGRRKTSADKLLIDEELFACRDAHDMEEAVLRYIIAYARDLQLQNHEDYHKLIERTKDFIHEKYNERLSLERVAAEAGVSACYLSKLFKKEVGVNFKQYVIRVRMEKAKLLLSIGRLNIGEVARACGYADPGYFCRMFRQYWGVLPKEFQPRT